MKHTTNDDLRMLHEATLTLLERTGVGIDSPRALECLAGAGVHADPTVMRVYPKARHVEAALSTAPRSMTVYGRRPDRDRPCVLGGDHVNVMSGGGSVRVLTIDGRYEPSSWEHLRQFNRLLDALPNIHMHINQVDPVDPVASGYYRRLAAEMLIGCTKPICFQLSSAQDVHAMVEMGVASRGSLQALVEQPRFMFGLNSEPPLHISGAIADAFTAACASGLPVSMGNYSMMGVTAPITVAGAVVQLNAVQMVAIILGQVVRRGTPICYTSFAGSADLHDLGENTSTPHASQLVRLGIEMGRFYGLPVYSNALTDAREPDPRAACERTYQMQACVEAGANLIQGPTSHMDQMMLSSYVQAVIDNDIVGYVLAACRRPVVSAETLALDAGHEVATDPEYAALKFASHEHTVRHLRDEVWEPWAFDRDNFAAWEKGGRVSVFERAAAKAREILDTHHPEPLPPAVADAIRRAVHAT
jgi:trimethylamine--corrinoid protein Co-methyltransferase